MPFPDRVLKPLTAVAAVSLFCAFFLSVVSQAFAQADPLQSPLTQSYREAVSALENGEMDDGLELLRQAGEAGDIRALALLHEATEIHADGAQGDDAQGDDAQGDRAARITAAIAELSRLPAVDLGRRVFNLGMAELAEEPPPSDPAFAVALIESAANTGYGPALVEIGTIYLDGQHVEPNGDRAINYLEQAVAAGEAWALLELGKAYRDGQDVESDGDRAVGYLERAAEAGVDWALVELGTTYRDGIAVAPDPDQALAYLEQAADAGVRWALVELGRSYRDGVGFSRDSNLAVDYLERAADAGVNWALVELGTTYRDGIAVAPDPDQALAYLEQAADAGVRWALVELGRLYRDGVGGGFNRDTDLAVDYFERAADAGVTWALIELGTSFRDGDGFPPDPDRANRYLERAAQTREPWALIELGIGYRTGFGVDANADIPAAIQQFEQAADAGVSSGALQLVRTLISPDQTTEDGVLQLVRYLEIDFGDQGAWLRWLYGDLNNNERVVLIQMLLNAAGRPVAIDGLFRRETIDEVLEICRQIRPDECRGPPLHPDTITLLHDAYHGVNTESSDDA